MEEGLTIIDSLVKYWPLISGVVFFIVGVIVVVWRMHTRTRINEKMIATHQVDDKEIHAALKHTVDNTYTMIGQINRRFDDVLNKVHDTHKDVSESINKQNTDIKILKSRVDRVGGNLADLKITIENYNSDEKK